MVINILLSMFYTFFAYYKHRVHFCILEFLTNTEKSIYA